MKVYVADDQAVVRRGVRTLVESQPGWLICGEAADGRTALAEAILLKPDVAVLDVALPEANGLVVTKLLRQAVPTTEVLLFSIRDDDETVSRGLAAGARGYLLKTEAEDLLVEAIATLARGQPYFSSVVSELLIRTALESAPRSHFQRFTARQLEITELIVEGKSNKMIAERLGLSPKTVESHRATAMRKAGVRTVSEFVRFAVRHKLVEV